MEIIVIEDPTEEIIKKDIKKADIVIFIHKNLNKKELKELIYSIIEANYKPMYVHFYSGEGKGNYTIGIKELKRKIKKKN